MNKFILHSEYKPTGDQLQAMDALVKGFKEGNQFQTLLGVTSSGKKEKQHGKKPTVEITSLKET